MNQKSLHWAPFTKEALFAPSQPVESILVDEVLLKTGDRVSLHPKRRADAMDLILAGKRAVIEAMEEDDRGRINLALVLEDDPGGDAGLMRLFGRRFFFGIDEVEPVAPELPS